MLQKLSTALALIFSSSMCSAASWYIVAENLSVQKPVVFLVDKDSIKRDGSMVRFWRWLIWEKNHDKSETDNGKTHILANCKTEEFRIDQFYMFNGDNLLMQMKGDEPYKPVLPGSMDESILKKVCSGKFKGNPVNGLTVEDLQKIMLSVKNSN